MPSPTPEALALAERYRLSLSFEARRGLAGERLGRGTGSSLEFQDRRAYQAGDDVRHLDWGAYARTDQLLVRQYREELLPRLELLVDTSRSMAVEEEKARRVVDLTAVLVQAARREGFRVHLIRLGDRPEPIESTAFLEHGLTLEAERPLAEVLREAAGLLRPGGLRILLSDFLFPHDPVRLLQELVRGTGALVLLQVLGRADAAPPLGQALRLIDAETGEERDLIVDAELHASYLERLGRLVQGLRAECERHAARLLEAPCELALEEVLREGVAAQGLIAPV